MPRYVADLELEWCSLCADKSKLTTCTTTYYILHTLQYGDSYYRTEWRHCHSVYSYGNSNTVACEMRSLLDTDDDDDRPNNNNNNNNNIMVDGGCLSIIVFIPTDFRYGATINFGSAASRFY